MNLAFPRFGRSSPFVPTSQTSKILSLLKRILFPGLETGGVDFADRNDANTILRTNPGQPDPYGLVVPEVGTLFLVVRHDPQLDLCRPTKSGEYRSGWVPELTGVVTCDAGRVDQDVLHKPALGGHELAREPGLPVRSQERARRRHTRERGTAAPARRSESATRSLNRTHVERATA